MKKWLFLLGGLAVLAAVATWLYLDFSTVTVQAALPERREAIRAVYAIGSVKAEQIARLRPELGGEVLKVGVIEGGEVRQGDLVLEVKVEQQDLQVRDFDARLEEAKLKVAETRAEYDRQQLLFEQGETTESAVANARAVYNQAVSYQKSVQSAISSRQSTVPDGRLFAPITGVVTHVGIHVGEVIPANVEAVTILDPSSFKVFAEINENDINLVKPGQEAIVAFDAMPGSRFKARVERVIPQAHEVTKTLPVVLNLIDYVPNLSDGLTATVNIVHERRLDALTIPESALLYQRFDSPTATVFVITDNNRLEERTVEIGVRGDDYVEVLQGLHENERVALHPERGWSDGMTVAVAAEERAR